MEPLMEQGAAWGGESGAAEPKVTARRPYSAPVLEGLGDIRDLTMGGSPGTGDSGAGVYTEFPPGWPG